MVVRFGVYDAEKLYRGAKDFAAAALPLVNIGPGMHQVWGFGQCARLIAINTLAGSAGHGPSVDTKQGRRFCSRCACDQGLCKSLRTAHDSS